MSARNAKFPKNWKNAAIPDSAKNGKKSKE